MTTDQSTDVAVSPLPHGDTETESSAVGDSMEENSRLHSSTLKVINSSRSKRAEFILADRMIRYPAMMAIQEQARWMMYEPSQTRASGRICCTPPGNGKTSLADSIAKKYPPTEDGHDICAIKISMEGCRDARSAYGRIMDQLGSPARISHRLSDRELIANRLLCDVRCRLLILDETQDLLMGTTREQQRTLESIKYIMNRRKLSVMAFGTEEAALALTADKHLAARFTQCELPLWKDDHVLRSFLATYERFLPLRQPSDLAEKSKVDLLLKHSGGVLDLIVKRIQNAALLALLQGRERVDLQLLEQGSQRPSECFLDRA
jgi:hypothetical protein